MYVELDGPSLRGTRLVWGLTQRALAQKAGVSVSTVRKPEKPRAVVTLHSARKIAWAFGVHPKDVARPVNPRRRERT